MGTFVENLATLSCERVGEASDQAGDIFYTVFLSKSVIKDIRLLKWALYEDDDDDDDNDDGGGDSGEEEDDSCVSALDELNLGDDLDSVDAKDYAYEKSLKITKKEDPEKKNGNSKNVSADIGDSPNERPDPLDVQVSSLSLSKGEKGGKFTGSTPPPQLTSSTLERNPGVGAGEDEDRNEIAQVRWETETMIEMGLPSGFLGDSFKRRLEIEAFVLRGDGGEGESCGDGGVDGEKGGVGAKGGNENANPPCEECDNSEGTSSDEFDSCESSLDEETPPSDSRQKCQPQGRNENDACRGKFEGEAVNEILNGNRHENAVYSEVTTHVNATNDRAWEKGEENQGEVTEDPRLIESWNLFWEENWKRLVYSTWIEKYYRHIDLEPLKEFLTSEGVEIAWEKYEKLTGTDSGFDEETATEWEGGAMGEIEEGNGEEIGRNGRVGTKDDVDESPEKNQKEESPVTVKGTRDQEANPGSVRREGEAEEKEAEVEEERIDKATTKVTQIRGDEENEKCHLSLASSSTHREGARAEKNEPDDDEGKTVMNDWDQLWSDHYNQVSWSEYHRFSEMFYVYGRYDHYHGHERRGEEGENCEGQSSGNRFRHHGGEPYDGKWKKKKQSGRQFQSCGSSSGGGGMVDGRGTTESWGYDDREDDGGEDGGKRHQFAVKSGHQLDADEMEAELIAMGYCWPASVASQPADADPNSRNDEDERGVTNCDSDLEKRGQLRILNGALSDIQANRWRWRRKRKLEIERKEEEDEEDEGDEGEEDSEVEKEEKEELETEASPVDRKTDEETSPESKPERKSEESSENEAEKGENSEKGEVEREAGEEVREVEVDKIQAEEEEIFPPKPAISKEEKKNEGKKNKKDKNEAKKRKDEESGEDEDNKNPSEAIPYHHLRPREKRENDTLMKDFLRKGIKLQAQIEALLAVADGKNDHDETDEKDDDEDDKIEFFAGKQQQKRKDAKDRSGDESDDSSESDEAFKRKTHPKRERPSEEDPSISVGVKTTITTTPQKERASIHAPEDAAARRHAPLEGEETGNVKISGNGECGLADDRGADEARGTDLLNRERAEETDEATKKTTMETINKEKIDLERNVGLLNCPRDSEGGGGVDLVAGVEGEKENEGEIERSLVSYDGMDLFFHDDEKKKKIEEEKEESREGESIRRVNKNKRRMDENGRNKKGKRKTISRRKWLKLPREIRENPSLARYWLQRYRLFSRYDEGIQLDLDGWFSATPEKIAIHHAYRCRSDVIVDGFCGVGGNAIQLAFTCERVIAIDNDATRLELAKHNAAVYGVEDRIEFILGDFFHVAKHLKADAVFLSPPWGGPEYLKEPVFKLKEMLPVDVNAMMAAARSISPNIAIYVPRTCDVAELTSLAAVEFHPPDDGDDDDDVENDGSDQKACLEGRESVNGVETKNGRGRGVGQVEIEQNMLNGRTKTVTAYFGDLILGRWDVDEGEEGWGEEEEEVGVKEVELREEEEEEEVPHFFKNKDEEEDEAEGVEDGE